MKVVATLTIAALIGFGGAVAQPNARVHASVPQAGGTPLEAVPIVKADHVARLTPDHAGSFQGLTIDHGFQFSARTNDNPNPTLELNLGGAYTALNGTMYYEASDSSANATIVIQDVSDPTAGIRQLFHGGISPGTQRAIKVDVRGVKLLLITERVSTTYSVVHADLVGTLQGAPQSAPPVRGSVIPSYPSAGAIIPANTSVVFLWHGGVAGATAYLLHVWLVRQSGTTLITPATSVSFSKLVFNHTSYTWNDSGFLPGTYQYDLMPLDHYGTALAGRSDPIQFTVSQAS